MRSHTHTRPPRCPRIARSSVQEARAKALRGRRRGALRERRRGLRAMVAGLAGGQMFREECLPNEIRVGTLHHLKYSHDLDRLLTMTQELLPRELVVVIPINGIKDPVQCIAIGLGVATLHLE